MRASVSLQHVVVEVFDAEAEPGHTDLLQRLELRLSQGAGLALEGDLLGVLPTHVPVESFDQVVELLLADV